jgi:hypothetical protein
VSFSFRTRKFPIKTTREFPSTTGQGGLEPPTSGFGDQFSAEVSRSGKPNFRAAGLLRDTLRDSAPLRLQMTSTLRVHFRLEHARQRSAGLTSASPKTIERGLVDGILRVLKSDDKG